MGTLVLLIALVGGGMGMSLLDSSMVRPPAFTLLFLGIRLGGEDLWVGFDVSVGAGAETELASIRI